MKGSDHFNTELKLIKDDQVRNVVIDLLDHYVNPANFEKPASSTGKYHPQFALGEGGLVRHTKAVVKLLQVIERARPSLNWDCLYAAAILHDMWKYSTSSKWTTKDHPKRAYDEVMFKSTTFSESSLTGKLEFIAEIVRYHMGRWDVEEFDDMAYKLPEEVSLMHYADMIASRPWYGTSNVFVREEAT
jgi:hypothetical protein